jgi:sec-independent protein translocase protein TatC
MVSIGALLGGMGFGMIVAKPVFAFITAPMRMLLKDSQPQPDVDALYLWLTTPIRMLMPASVTQLKLDGSLALTQSPMEGVYTWLQVALITGALLAAPIITYQIWQFVAPGLYSTERKVVIPLTFSSTALFVIGVGFCYTVMFPIAFPFFLQVLPAERVISIGGYLNTATRMLLAFGIAFQLPVGVWFAARLGFIDHKDMVKGFRYAVVVLFTVAAILTPPDITTQIILAVPLCFLYVASIAVAWMWTTKKRES